MSWIKRLILFLKRDDQRLEMLRREVIEQEKQASKHK